MKPPWQPPLGQWFSAGAISALATLVAVQVAADIFTTAGDYRGLGGLSQALAVMSILRLAVLPLAIIICAGVLRLLGKQKEVLGIALMTGAGTYVAFELSRLFGPMTVWAYLLMAIYGGAWCVICGMIISEVPSRSTRLGLACFTVAVLFLLTPFVVRPLGEWQEQRAHAQLSQQLIHDVHFTPYTPPNPTTRPLITLGGQGLPIVAFGADPYTQVFESEVLQGQTASIDPPRKCNLEELYRAVDNLGSWQAVYGRQQQHVSACQLIVTTPKGRRVYGEQPPGQSAHTYYARIGTTNIILRLAAVYVDQRGTEFDEYITGIVDALVPVRAESLAVDRAL